MAEVKWIKTATDMYEDEKICFIEGLPKGDALLVIWGKLLALAGKCNANGYIFITEDIPYTEEILAHILRRQLNIVKLALSTFEKLGMIEIDENGYIYLINWEKHQNIDGLEKIREQTRKRVAKHRELKALSDGNVTCNANVTHSNATDIDKELDKDKDIEKELDKEIYREIIQYLNSKTNKSYKHNSKATKRLISARLNEGFTLDDFKKVIDIKVKAWSNDKKMNTYLRPETLFGTKFESYLNEKIERQEEENKYGW